MKDNDFELLNVFTAPPRMKKYRTNKENQTYKIQEKLPT